MVFLILIAFICVPLIEIGLFIQVGGFIGLWPTLLVVILTAVAGTALLRQQGLQTMARLQNSLERGEQPIGPLFDGFCVLAAGFLLLTPGFFTDALGFLLFTPPFRALLRRFIASRIHVRPMNSATMGSTTQGTWTNTEAPSEIVIEADYEDVTAQKDPTHLSDKSS